MKEFKTKKLQDRVKRNRTLDDVSDSISVRLMEAYDLRANPIKHLNKKSNDRSVYCMNSNIWFTDLRVTLLLKAPILSIKENSKKATPLSSCQGVQV